MGRGLGGNFVRGPIPHQNDICLRKGVAVPTRTAISVSLNNSQQGWGKRGGNSILVKDVYIRIKFPFRSNYSTQNRNEHIDCYRYTYAPTVYTHKAIEIWQSKEQLRAPNINNKRPT